MLKRSRQLVCDLMPAITASVRISLDEHHSIEIASQAGPYRGPATCYPQEILRNRYFLLNGESELGRKDAEAFGALKAPAASILSRSQPLVSRALWISRNVES